MELTWDILYRGPLDSCNYDCGYCPFAKRTNSREKIDSDREKLERFVAWVGAQRSKRIGVASCKRGIQRADLVHQHADRPAV